MPSAAHAAAIELGKLVNLAGPFIGLRLKVRQDQNPLHEFFHRLKSCRLAVLRIDQLVRGQARMLAAELAASQAAKQSGDHKKFSFHIKRMNRRRKRMLQEAFMHIEAFYWNASRASDSAVSLGLIKKDEPYHLLDAIKVRHLLIEHEKVWSRPLISLDVDPVLKPSAAPPPKMVTQGGVFTHARQLAIVLRERVIAALEMGMSPP